MATEVERAHKSAQKRADELLAATQKEAKETAAKRLDKAALRKIIDNTILSEFK